MTLAPKPSPVQRTTLPNGITVLVVENRAADLVAGKIFLKQGGGRWETPTQAGLSHLVAALLTKGTAGRSALDIADTIESLGASLGASAASDYFSLGLKTVTRDFPEILSLAAELMRSPSFPEAQLELERKITLQNIQSQWEQPFNVAFSELRSQMYPDHPYGVSILGTADTVPTLTREHLQDYHRCFFRPDNVIMSFSGNITSAEAIAQVERSFGDWTNPADPLTPLTINPIVGRSHTRTTIKESQQSIVMIGYLGPTITDPDYAALKLISTYLGNGLSSRLFVELREKRGLAYDVSAFFPSRLHQSQFVVYIGTAPPNTATALEGLETEVKRLGEVLLSDAEIQAAKNKLLGQYALGKQTNGELAQIFGWYETLGLGVQFDHEFQHHINDLTPAQLQRAAQRYLQIPYYSLVGPEAFLKPWQH